MVVCVFLFNFNMLMFSVFVNSFIDFEFELSLIHDMDATKKVVDTKSEEKGDKDFIPHFTTDNNGNIVSNYSEKNDNFDNSKRSPNFNYDLE